MGFGGFTFNKTLAARVKAFFALAPVTVVKNIQGAFYLISLFYKEIEVSFSGCMFYRFICSIYWY